MKNRSKEIIEEEEDSVDFFKKELKKQKSKWIKTSPALRLISFLEHVIKEKEEYVKRLKSYSGENDKPPILNSPTPLPPTNNHTINNSNP